MELRIFFSSYELLTQFYNRIKLTQVFVMEMKNSSNVNSKFVDIESSLFFTSNDIISLLIYKVNVIKKTPLMP